MTVFHDYPDSPGLRAETAESHRRAAQFAAYALLFAAWFVLGEAIMWAAASW